MVPSGLLFPSYTVRQVCFSITIRVKLTPPASCCIPRGLFPTAVPGWISSLIRKTWCLCVLTGAVSCRQLSCCVRLGSAQKKCWECFLKPAHSTWLKTAVTHWIWSLPVCGAILPHLISRARAARLLLKRGVGSRRAIFVSWKKRMSASSKCPLTTFTVVLWQRIWWIQTLASCCLSVILKLPRKLSISCAKPG